MVAFEHHLLLIQAKQIGSQIFCQHVLFLPFTHVHDTIILAISVVIEVAVAIVEERCLAVYLQELLLILITQCTNSLTKSGRVFKRETVLR